MIDQLYDPEYVAARRVLLDALVALRPHRSAVIVAGAQAVYLRTGSADLAVAPFTTDADLALDPTRLGDDPRLGDAMETAGFALHRHDGGHPEPGVWERSTAVDGRDYLIPVDLTVPEAVAVRPGRRGARLGFHGNQAARRAVGLEAALVDREPLTIEALEPGDHRRAVVGVAGAGALLVAKAHKLRDRVRTGRPTRLSNKDAADVFRLMQTADAAHITATLNQLTVDPVAGQVTRAGLRYLVDLFGRSASTGVTMAVAALELAVPPERIAAVCNGFVANVVVPLSEEAP
ncbi:MAG: hypothetical protein ACRDZR_05215 [Acidimicrobiales bacterium]